MKYTVDYFIDKFTKIPESEWTTGELTKYNDEDCHCALGHCGVRILADNELTPEADALCELFKGGHFTGDKFDYVVKVNDKAGEEEWGATPKERVLNKLKSLK